MQINVVVSRLLAFSLNDLAVSVLYLANRLVELPLGVFTIAVVTVAFPSISRSIARKDTEGLQREYGGGLRLSFAISVPAALGLIVLREPILNLLFVWGHFSVDDVALVAPVLVIYAIGLPFYSLATYVTRGFHALKDMKTPFKVALWAFVLNCLLSIIFMRIWAMEGLAAANVVVMGGQSIFLHLLLTRKETACGQIRLKGALVRILVASGLMAALVWGIGDAIHIIFSSQKGASLAVVLIGIPISVYVYFVILKVLKFEDMNSFRLLFIRSKA